MIRLHELRIEGPDGEELTFNPHEAVDLASLAADSSEHVQVVAWSPREVDVVSEAPPGEAGEDSVLIPIWSAWLHVLDPEHRRFRTLTWQPTSGVPSEWDWALPSAETWARTLLDNRHQCYRFAPDLDPLLRATSVCECERKGVRFWADAAAKNELGCVVSPAIAERYCDIEEEFDDEEEGNGNGI